MKYFFLTLMIAFTVIAACNPPQKSTGTSTDSTSVNNNTLDTSVSTQRDTSMHK